MMTGCDGVEIERERAFFKEFQPYPSCGHFYGFSRKFLDFRVKPLERQSQPPGESAHEAVFLL